MSFLTSVANALGMTLSRVFILMVMAASSGTAVAAPALTLSDGRDGVSCGYLVSGSKVAWQRPGGDWVDASGVAFGPKAFDVTRVSQGRRGQLVIVDVTTLAQRWRQGDGPIGGILLAGSPEKKAGGIRFHSRESDDPASRPVLRITWDDGRVSEWAPSADASLNCTTVRPLGGSKIIAVGAERKAILQFPVALDRGIAIRTAELNLTVERQSSATVAVYRPLLPWEAASHATVGFASGFPGDQGIRGHRAVIHAEFFESEAWRSSLSPVSKGSNVRLTEPNGDRGFVPLAGRALKVTVPAGKLLGLNTHYRFAENLGQEPEEMFFRYALRFGDDWNPTVSGGKMPGFSGTYGRAGWGGRKANGSNGWSARGAFFESRAADLPLAAFRGVGSYVYAADMSGDFGAVWGWSQGRTGMLLKNQWYSIEQQVRLNSPGRNDGVLRAWIDGDLVFERTDMRFRDVPDLKIESLWLNVYHGGLKPAVVDMSLYIDNLIIAREYIGPVSK